MLLVDMRYSDIRICELARIPLVIMMRSPHHGDHPRPATQTQTDARVINFVARPSELDRVDKYGRCSAANAINYQIESESLINFVQ